MSLDRFRLPRLGDKLREQAEEVEAAAEKEDVKKIKRSVIIKKKSKKHE